MVCPDRDEGDPGPVRKKQDDGRGQPGDDVHITEDGGVVKTCVSVIEDFDSKCAPVFSRVYITMSISCKESPDVTVFDSPHEEVDFCLGRSETARGLEMCLGTMKIGERAIVSCTSEYGFNDANRPAGMQLPSTSCTLLFDVTLHRWETESNLWDISDGDRFSIAKRHRQIGNEQYTQGKFTSSIRSYKRSLAALESMSDGKSERRSEDVDYDDAQSVKFFCHSNSGACHVRLADWDAAVSSCSKALDMKGQGSNVKCLYRRGVAYGRKENFTMALRDLKKAYSLEPSHILRESIQQIKKYQYQADEHARKQLGGFMKSGLNLYNDKPDAHDDSIWRYFARSSSVIAEYVNKMLHPITKYCKKHKQS
uniref:peptidylprolyl isomerase n=1 Tax=Spongospora subterranea TaxID=70186 RepID=A0A0H5R9A2_9EUKA|eukprot:CRZ10705.1 hypothetical protein [Spongospora subterranea]